MNLFPIVPFAFYAVALILLTVGGNVFCRLVLKLCDLSPTPKPAPAADASTPETTTSTMRAGRTIGSLERLLIMLGLAANSWEVMIAVIALKTIARYQELDRRIEAEYFLVGSLASILWAVLVTVVTLYVDRTTGLNVASALLALRGG